MISFYVSLVGTDDDKEKVVFIYENFYSFMAYNAGQVLNHNKHDVEDVVHNAMLKIIEHIDKIDLSDENRAKNLCGIIAKNLAKDHCKLKDNQNLSLDGDISESTDGGETPDDIVITKDTYDIILKELFALDDRYRDICILKYLYEYKEREIAGLLGITHEAVRMRIFRGKQILREALRKENLHV